MDTDVSKNLFASLMSYRHGKTMQEYNQYSSCIWEWEIPKCVRACQQT